MQQNHILRSFPIPKHPLNEQQESDLRFNQEPVSRDLVPPGSRQRASLFRRLMRQLEENSFLPGLAKLPAQSVNPELFVPDGRMALLIREGRPEGLLQPGRHSLDVGKAKLEVRLFSSEILRDHDRDRLDLLMDMLYERALLYVDGVQMAIVKPDHQPQSPSWNLLDASQPSFPGVELEKRTSHPAAFREEDEMIQEVLLQSSR